MEVVAITSAKGGTSKTSTTQALAYGLHAKGKTVLMIDADAQANLSFSSGVDFKAVQADLYSVFKGADIDKAILEIKPGLHIVPGSVALMAADREFTGQRSFLILRDAVRKMQKRVDYVLIDTPPAVGLLTQNALAVADKLILPMRPDGFGLQGPSQMMAYIAEQRKRTNPGLQIDGILLTQCNSRNNVDKIITEQIYKMAERMGTKVYKSKIRMGTAVPASGLMRKSIYDAYPKAGVTLDYSNFVDEFMGGMTWQRIK